MTTRASAVRVMAEAYDRVTIVDRDQLPDQRPHDSRPEHSR
jgi:hypothetical protein